MGRKIVGVYVCLNCIAVLFEVIAASMTWHSTRVMVLGATIFRMKAGLLTVSVDAGASLLCKVSEKYCDILEDGIDLREAAQQWCAPAIVQVAAGPCDAFSTAFYMGLFVTFALIANIIVLGVSCLLLYRYAAEKHKPIYRQTAIIMHLFATLALLTMTILYWVLAGQQLDNILSDRVPSGSGTGYGQILFFVAILVQVAAAAMTNCVSMGDEQTEEDYLIAKMAKEKMHQYGSAKGFQASDGPAFRGLDAEHGGNQAFGNGPTDQATFVPSQQDLLHAGYASPQSTQPLAPQPSYMMSPAVSGQNMTMTTSPSYTGGAAW